jgi:hypothetical protein
MQTSISEVTGDSLSAVGPLSGALSFGTALSRGRSTASNRTVQSVPLEEVPTELHRRAAQLIEDVRNGGSVPTWESAQLSDTVTPFLRPDIDGIAFFEFEVDPTGFIVLSTDTHDFPLPHWNHLGRPISRLLERRARTTDDRVEQVYRLDTLTYAAENEDGDRVARYGEPMVKLEGLGPEWLEGNRDISRATITPSVSTESDDEFNETIEFTITRSGPEPPPVTVEPWESWRELKDGYGDVYELLIEHLRREARIEWEEYRRPRRLDIEAAPTDTLALLYRDGEPELSGRGADFVDADVVTRGELPPAVEITLLEDPGEEVPFSISLSYSNGLREEIEFVITTADRQNKVFASGASTFAGTDSSHTVYCGGGYTVSSAGTASHQPMYHSFEVPDCDPGAGAVAWAMLFGWADYQADRGHPRWSPRWGIFRLDGGTDTQPNDVAPLTQTAAIETVIEELQGHIKLCVGPTNVELPSQMINANFYLNSRTGAVAYSPFDAYYYNNEARTLAIDEVVTHGTPAVIGTGFGNKYLLAWRYAERSSSGSTSGGCQRLFYVNHGEGSETDADECLDNGHGWIPAKAWLGGRLDPKLGAD